MLALSALSSKLMEKYLWYAGKEAQHNLHICRRCGVNSPCSGQQLLPDDLVSDIVQDGGHHRHRRHLDLRHAALQRQVEHRQDVVVQDHTPALLHEDRQLLQQGDAGLDSLGSAEQRSAMLMLAGGWGGYIF